MMARLSAAQVELQRLTDEVANACREESELQRRAQQMSEQESNVLDAFSELREGTIPRLRVDDSLSVVGASWASPWDGLSHFSGDDLAAFDCIGEAIPDAGVPP